MLDFHIARELPQKLLHSGNLSDVRLTYTASPQFASVEVEHMHQSPSE